MPLKQYALFATESLLMSDQLNISIVGLVEAQDIDFAASSLGYKLDEKNQINGYYPLESERGVSRTLWLREIVSVDSKTLSQRLFQALEAPMIISTDKEF